MRVAFTIAVALGSFALLGCSSDSESALRVGGTDAGPDGAGGGAGGRGMSPSGGAPTGGARSAGGASASGGRNSGGSGTVGSGGRSSGGVAGSGGSTGDASVSSDAATSEQDSGSVDHDSGPPDAGPDIRRIRFVNVSPTAAPLDICVKVTGSASFTAQPLLRAQGITTGLPYGSITDYFDLDPTQILDFEFVEASSTTCVPPVRGAVGNLEYRQVRFHTMAIYQYQFSPVDGYNGALLLDQGAPAQARASVRFYDAAQLGPAFTDFYVTPPGTAEALWFPHVPFGTGGTAFHDAGIGAYTLRVTAYNTQTVLAQKSLSFAGNQAVDAFLFSTSATAFGLLSCPSMQTTRVAACAF